MLRVWKGAKPDVNAGFLADRYLTLPKGKADKLALTLESKEPLIAPVLNGLGESWLMERIVFKPYACGTMIHPYIDCMIRLAQQGVGLSMTVHPTKLRAVTHLDVDDEDIDRAIELIPRALGALARA